MSFEPQRARIRDGRECVIRQASLADVPQLLELERAVVLARHGVVKFEDELARDAATYLERLRPRLSASAESAMTLVAELAPEGIVGEASLERLPLRMLRHVGVLAMAVIPSVQGLGIGRSLLRHLVAWARSHRDANGEQVLRIELQVRADNAPALALYRSLGFTLEGVRRAFCRRDDGSFVDDLLMSTLSEPARAE